MGKGYRENDNGFRENHLKQTTKLPIYKEEGVVRWENML